MQPLIKDGDTVIASSVPYLFMSPRINDIIVYRDSETKTYFIKRVTRKKRDTYYIMGDNTRDSTDSRSFGWINRKDIVGKVIFTMPKSKKAFL